MPENRSGQFAKTKPVGVRSRCGQTGGQRAEPFFRFINGLCRQQRHAQQYLPNGFQGDS